MTVSLKALTWTYCSAPRGLLACIAIMVAVMPLAMRLGRRLTRSTATTPAPGGTTSTPQPPNAPTPQPPRQEP